MVAPFRAGVYLWVYKEPPATNLGAQRRIDLMF
jgi:hypothetical protein